MRLVSALLILCVALCDAAQKIPFLELLNSESVMQLAQVAAQLTQQTSQQAARNEKEIMMRNEAPAVKPITLDQRPSEIFGQAFTNLARPLKMQTFDAVEHPERLLAPPQGDRRRAPAAAAPAAAPPLQPAAALLHAALFPSSAQPVARNATTAKEIDEDLTRIDDLEKEIKELREQLEARKQAAAAAAESTTTTTTENPKPKEKKKRTKKDRRKEKEEAAAAKTAVNLPMKSDISLDEPIQQAPASGSTGNLFTDMFRAFGGSALMGAVMPKQPAQEERSRGEIEIRRERMHGDTIFSALGSAPIQPEVASAAAAPVRATAGLAAAPPPPDVSPLMQLASAFLKGPSGGAPRAEGVGTARASAAGAQSLPSIQQVVPGANQNFGIPRGQGCLPFLGEFMQIAYGNCVKDADEAAYSAWSSELSSAVMAGKMDILRASRESCKRGAEREQCNQLRQAISNCDIMDSLQVATSLQRNLKRCEEISGVIDQNPITVMNQIGHLVNGEFAHGFLNNFLGGR